MNIVLANTIADLSRNLKVATSKPKYPQFWFWVLLAFLVTISSAHAGPRIPGADASDKLEAAGTTLRLVDTFIFIWGARLFAGICIVSGGWNLKEQRFGLAVVCIIASLVIGTSPVWVENIFSIGGGNGIFN
jgi:hypothetical protein